MARETTDQIIARRKREAESERKYAETPLDLTNEDLHDLSAESLSDAMTSGKLAHLGYGARSAHR